MQFYFLIIYRIDSNLLKMLLLPSIFNFHLCSSFTHVVIPLLCMNGLVPIMGSIKSLGVIAHVSLCVLHYAVNSMLCCLLFYGWGHPSSLLFLVWRMKYCIPYHDCPFFTLVLFPFMYRTLPVSRVPHCFSI